MVVGNVGPVVGRGQVGAGIFERSESVRFGLLESVRFGLIWEFFAAKDFIFLLLAPGQAHEPQEPWHAEQIREICASRVLLTADEFCSSCSSGKILWLSFELLAALTASNRSLEASLLERLPLQKRFCLRSLIFTMETDFSFQNVCTRIPGKTPISQSNFF
jgi:hypothetical protein